MIQLVLHATSQKKCTSDTEKTVHNAITRAMYCMEISENSPCQRYKLRPVFFISLSNISRKPPLLQSTSEARHTRINIRVGTCSLIPSNSTSLWTIWLAKLSYQGLNNTISSLVFSSEQIRILPGARKLTSSPKKAFEQNVGNREAKLFYRKKRKIKKDDTEKVWWNGIESALNRFSKIFQVRLMKHALRFNGTNIQLSRWNEKVKNICPNYGCRNKFTGHNTRC